MNGFRQNNGIEVVVIVILSLIAITYIIIIIRGQRHLKSMNLSDIEAGVEPATQHEWMNDSRAKAYEADILDIGFISAGSFTTDIGIELTCFLNDDRTECAVIAMAQDDLYLEFTAHDEQEHLTIDVSDNKTIAQLTPKPHKISIAKPELSSFELYAHFKGVIKNRSLRRMPRATLQQVLEDDFEREMKAILAGGSPVDVDLDNLVKHFGEHLSEKERKKLIHDTRKVNMERRWDHCFDRLKKSGQLTKKEFKEHQYRLLATQLDEDVNLYIEVLLDNLMLNKRADEATLKEQLLEAESSEEVVQLLTLLKPELKISLLASFEDPVCMIYTYDETHKRFGRS